MVKLGINGARGRMGQRIIALAKDDHNFDVSFGVDIKNHPDIGKIIEGVKIFGDFSLVGGCDCVIDFSLPPAILDHLEKILEAKKALVIGTTGFTKEQQAKITESSKKIPIVFSPNMSIGVNVLFNLLSQAAKTLQGYAVEVEEAHHIHKKDAPSGTAKKIAEVINDQGFNIKFEDIKAIREGEIVGDHKVVFESGVDKITLSHSAKTRDIFAKGALVAASWVAGKPAGMYSMNDVLSLNKGS